MKNLHCVTRDITCTNARLECCIVLLLVLLSDTLIIPNKTNTIWWKVSSLLAILYFTQENKKKWGVSSAACYIITTLSIEKHLVPLKLTLKWNQQFEQTRVHIVIMYIYQLMLIVVLFSSSGVKDGSRQQTRVRGELSCLWRQSVRIPLWTAHLWKLQGKMVWKVNEKECILYH